MDDVKKVKNLGLIWPELDQGDKYNVAFVARNFLGDGSKLRRKYHTLDQAQFAPELIFLDFMSILKGLENAGKVDLSFRTNETYKLFLKHHNQNKDNYS